MPCDVDLFIMRRRLESFVPQTGQLHGTRLHTLEIWVCHMQSPGQSDHHYYGLRTTASVIRRARVVIIFANGSRAVQNVNRRWAAKSRRACVLLFLCSQNFAGLSRFSPFFWRSCWRWSLWKGNLSKQIEVKQIEIHAQIQQNKQETRNRKFEVATRRRRKGVRMLQEDAAVSSSCSDCVFRCWRQGSHEYAGYIKSWIFGDCNAQFTSSFTVLWAED